MAVAGYMGTSSQPDWNGQTRDWAWVLRQWDRIATAGKAVRLVVVDNSYTGLTSTALSQITNKLQKCRNAQQIVCGYVFVSGGRLPLGPPGSWWSFPTDPNTGQVTGPITQVPAGTAGAYQCVQDQIDAWRNAYPNVINGIYADVGPMDCLAPGTLGGQANIVANYAQYCQYIRSFGYQVFLLTPQYDDQDPNQPGWLRALPWNFLGLWEEKADTYRNSFNAWNVCANSFTAWPGTPDASWWDPGRVGRPASERATRVHIINGGAKVIVRLGLIGSAFPSLQAAANRLATMINLCNLMQLAQSRGSSTVWITEAGRDPILGSVYDQLPPYWDDEVALCT